MKAIVVHEFGGPEVLKFEAYPDPVPGAGEVLVKVAAASVNPVDYKRRAGLTQGFLSSSFSRPYRSRCFGDCARNRAGSGRTFHRRSGLRDGR